MQYNMTMTNHICNIKFNLHSSIIYDAFCTSVHGRSLQQEQATRHKMRE